MKAIKFFAALGLLLGCSVSWAQSVTGSYLMSFHSCDKSLCEVDPMHHTVRLVESDDLLAWSPVTDFPEDVVGSVPDVVSVAGEAYVYFLDVKSDPYYPQVIVMNQTDGASEQRHFEILDSFGATVAFVDPSAILDSSGNIVLFYVKHTTPGGCASYPCTLAVHSATEDRTTVYRGTSFSEDPGQRYSVTFPTLGHITDPDVFESASGGYLMLVAHGTEVWAFQNTSLNTGRYSPISALSSSPNRLIYGQTVPSGIYATIAGSSAYYIFAHSVSSPSHIRASIQSSISGPLYASDFDTVMTGGKYGAPINTPAFTYSVASPGVAEVFW